MWSAVRINPFCRGGMDMLWHYTSSHFNWFYWGIDMQVPYCWDLRLIFQEWTSHSVSKMIVPLVTMFEVHWAIHSAPLQSKKKYCRYMYMKAVREKCPTRRSNLSHIILQNWSELEQQHWPICIFDLRIGNDLSSCIITLTWRNFSLKCTLFPPNINVPRQSRYWYIDTKTWTLGSDRANTKTNTKIFYLAKSAHLSTICLRLRCVQIIPI